MNTLSRIWLWFRSRSLRHQQLDALGHVVFYSEALAAWEHEQRRIEHEIAEVEARRSRAFFPRSTP